MGNFVLGISLRLRPLVSDNCAFSTKKKYFQLFLKVPNKHSRESETETSKNSFLNFW